MKGNIVHNYKQKYSVTVRGHTVLGMSHRHTFLGSICRLYFLENMFLLTLCVIEGAKVSDCQERREDMALSNKGNEHTNDMDFGEMTIQERLKVQ